MVRTQIQLTEEQYRQLRRWSGQLGISLAEAVRRCVARQMAEDEAKPRREELVRRALAACGRFREPKGTRDVAAEHDRYLADAYER